MKVKEKQIQKIIPKQIQKIVNNKKTKPLDKRKNSIKKKLQISKTLSMGNISEGPKYTARQKSSVSDKLLNNSVEEFDYLNFSDIDIDLIKKISSNEKDIFNLDFYSKKPDNKKDIVQNRYNIIDTSFNTSKKEEIINKSVDEYIEINKNNLIKTPSTICNYYDIDSEKKNFNNNKIEEIKKTKLLNKQIKIEKNCVINYNNPIYTQRTKSKQYNSSSNINIQQNTKRKFNNTNVGFYKHKKTISNIYSKEKKFKTKEIMTPITNDRNKIKTNKTSSQTKFNNKNLMKSYLEINNKIFNNKTHSNKDKKFLSIKQYSEYISSKVIKKNKTNSNCNFTFNNDITSYLKKKQTIQDLFDSIKEIKETINNNLEQNSSNESEENKENINQKKQKPIMLCLNKPKYNSYFKTPKNSNSDKKGKKSTISNDKYNEIHLGKNNIVLPNYTGRNYQKSCESIKRDIIVKRKKKEKTNDFGNSNINYCTKSINSSMNAIIKNNNNSAKMNITFHNYINDCIDKPIIRVNLKKHIKSTSQLMKFINVNSRSNKQKVRDKAKNQNSRCLSNKSFVSTCTKRTINTSQLIKDLLTKKNILKSPTQTKNNNSMLKTSKTSKENTSSFINKVKSISKSSRHKKDDKNSTKQNKNLVGSNNNKYYSMKYETNLKGNASSKIERNKNNKIYNKNSQNKNCLKPKTQSDIKVHKFNIKEENKENIFRNENEEYGMDKRVKQKLLDRMNKVTKNTFSNIWGTKKNNDNFSEMMKTPFINKDYSLTHKNFYNKKIISNENSKNEEKDYKYDKSIEKRKQFKFKIIKDYDGIHTYNNFLNI